jgi:hypothetical protein
VSDYFITYQKYDFILFDKGIWKMWFTMLIVQFMVMIFVREHGVHAGPKDYFVVVVVVVVVVICGSI